MEATMMENGKRMRSMDSGREYSQMAIPIQVNGIKGKHKGQEYLLGQAEKNMKDNLSMMRDMESAHTTSKMEVNPLENGKKERNMVKGQ